jgi:opacity protein-like surface antigen
VGFNFGGDAQCPEINSCEDRTTTWGVAVGTLGNVVGFEEEFAYSKNFFGEAPGLESSVLTLMSNLVIGPRIKFVRPYAVGGVGLIKTDFEFTPLNLLDTSNNSFGWDVGGGLMLGGRHVGVRGDVRYFHSFKDLEILGVSIGGDTKLDFGRATAALFLSW